MRERAIADTSALIALEKINLLDVSDELLEDISKFART